MLAPEVKLSQAWAMATSDDEQAVSMEMQGPCRFKKKAMRAAKMEVALPVKPWALN